MTEFCWYRAVTVILMSSNTWLSLQLSTSAAVFHIHQWPKNYRYIKSLEWFWILEIAVQNIRPVADLEAHLEMDHIRIEQIPCGLCCSYCHKKIYIYIWVTYEHKIALATISCILNVVFFYVESQKMCNTEEDYFHLKLKTEKVIVDLGLK